MNPSHLDPRLISLLTDLLSEESLPPADRWFSAAARERHWTPTDQKRLWDALRRALCRGFALAGHKVPSDTAWSKFRVALRGKVREWAELAERAAAEPSMAESGIPFWWKDWWEERASRSGWSSQDRSRFLAAQELPAPVHVRFRYGAEGDEARARLLAAGAVVPSQVDQIFELKTSQALEGTDEWRRGLIEIQDAASQLSLKHLGLRPGQRVWDVCAGRGGKTLGAASELRGKGAILATDVSEGKLSTLKERIRRSGWQNIRLKAWDGESPPDFGAELSQGFDSVIVDAPCTASGTWRRDPESRYRVTPGAIRDLTAHQARLLRLGWSALKPGGKLAYVTCSWLPAENEAVVETFVSETGAGLKHEELLGLPSFDANTVYSAILEKPRSKA